MKLKDTRRKFIKQAALVGAGLTLPVGIMESFAVSLQQAEKKVGVIGLDTEHSIHFTKLLNDPKAQQDLAGFRVVTAYPQGSKDIESSVKVIPRYTEDIKKLGVEIVDSIEALIKKVDVVLLETNDGRVHLEQAVPVIKAGKPLFIDKPITASLADAIAIFNLASKHNVPVFSASSLRYMTSVEEVLGGKIGKVMGADAYSPAVIEKTHPDLFWYGVHGVETLFSVMGTGCKQVTRFYSDGTDVVVGVWDNGRIGTFRGIRTGKHDFGGTAFGDTGIAKLGPWEGYRPLVAQIVQFFRSGKAPVAAQETLEIFAFMEAAQESKRKGGAKVSIDEIMASARKQAKY